MSSINDVMEEERTAQRLVRDAEQKAEAILRDAKASAAAKVSKAQTDDALLKELTERHKERMAAQRAEVLKECQARVEETERSCRANLGRAVDLIVDSVLGEELEQRVA